VPNPGAAPDPGSFRDPLSRVYIDRDAVYRGLSEAGAREYDAVASADFFKALLAQGSVVATERVPIPAALVGTEWAAVLRHDRLPLISYPFEWTFEMLRDAALLQLDVAQRALTDGFITKDATSYNIQFDGSRPVFIDVGSFERPPRGEPWPGYRQFCELFLNPLVVQHVTGIPFQPWLRGALDGIPPSQVAPLIRGRHRFNRRLLIHVVLHARAERRYADTDATRDVRGEMRQAGFGPKIVAAQLANLERTVRSLRSRVKQSTWSGYQDRPHYDAADLAAKDLFVADTVAEIDPGLVLDLGANDGRFSEIALDKGAQRVIAVDSDPLVVDRLYAELRARGEHRILPLVLDLANPSPGLGWRGQERQPFTARTRPDLVLCLAVVHHLALTNTVPFDHIVDLLADFGAPLVVELPLRDDPMVQRMLARKRAGLFDHYHEANWETALQRRFVVARREALPSGRRLMYRCSPR
jgi:hypothetical protein